VDVDAEAVGSVLEELSRIDVAIGMVECALALRHSISPVAVVFCAVLPQLFAFAMLDKYFFLGLSIEY
jgi:hypothetical protein